MNRYHELIIEVVQGMRAEGYGNRGDVHVYAARDVYKSFRNDSEYMLGTTQQQEFMSDPPVTSSGEGFPETTTYETRDIVKLDGMLLFEEHRMDSGEILIFDSGGLKSSPIDEVDPFIEHPVCVEKIQTRTTEETGDRVRCANCDKMASEAVVEGDNGDLYCSIACLNEVYA